MGDFTRLSKKIQKIKKNQHFFFGKMANKANNMANNMANNAANNAIANANALFELQNIYNITDRTLKTADGVRMLEFAKDKDKECAEYQQKLDEKELENKQLKKEKQEDREGHRDFMSIVKHCFDEKKRKAEDDASSQNKHRKVELVAINGDIVTDLYGTITNVRSAVPGCKVYKVEMERSGLWKYHILKPDGSYGGGRAANQIRRE